MRAVRRAEDFRVSGTYRPDCPQLTPRPVSGHADNRGESQRNRPHRARVGYPSPVCSISGDEIDRIAAAIDQLATDAKDRAGDPEMAARVAALWQMVSDLDPELARRRDGYTATADGTPAE